MSDYNAEEREEEKIRTPAQRLGMLGAFVMLVIILWVILHNVIGS